MIDKININIGFETSTHKPEGSAFAIVHDQIYFSSTDRAPSNRKVAQLPPMTALKAQQHVVRMGIDKKILAFRKRIFELTWLRSKDVLIPSDDEKNVLIRHYEDSVEKLKSERP